HSSFDTAYYLAEEDGDVLAYAGPGRAALSQNALKLIRSTKTRHVPLVSTLELDEKGAPVVNMAVLTGGVKGRRVFLVASIDPARVLYPLLRSWPSPSPSGEALLVRRDGDSVLFLNELRHLKDTALKLRQPISAEDLPAAVALRGGRGVISGRDYRGMPVLAWAGQVDGTEWMVISKIDKAEVFTTLRRATAMLFGLILALLLAGGIGFYAFLARQEAAYARGLLEAEARFARLYQEMLDSYVYVSMDGRILECNAAYERLTGYSLEELKRRTYVELTPEAWHKAEERIVKEEILKKGASGIYEKEYRRKDGSLVPIELRTVLDRDAAGKPSGMWAIIRDITGRKSAQRELEREMGKAAAYLEIAGVMFVAIDAHQRVSLINNKGCALLGRKKEDIFGKNWFDLAVPPAQRDAVKSIFAALMAGKGEMPEYYENEVTAIDGAERLISWHNTVLRDEAGNITGTLSSGEDITDRRRAETALKESEQRFRQLFEAMAEGFAIHEIICDAEGRPVDYLFLDVNPAFERLTGLKKEDIVGRTCLEVMPSTEKIWIENYGRVALGGEPMHFESASAALGRVYEVNAFCPRKGRFAVSFFDVTERRRAEREIEALNKVLLEKNREMENFLYITTHDLRGPLVNIQGFSQNLQQYFGEMKNLAADLPAGDRPRAEELAGQKIPECLKFMLESSARMDAMLTALLKVSRLGRQELKSERVDAGKLLRTLTDAMEFQLQEAGAEVKPGPLPPCRADALSVNQLFGNLLDNAVKYRDPARPLVIEISGEEAAGKAVYRFRDNGLGIAAVDLDRIWDIFSAQKRAGEKKGEGIGLHMVKRIAERNGGSIRAESEPGQGSVFILELPVWEG
ncbi:MAG: PAS domain S-box protein, partial [Elusimicrobiales bacterium]